MEKALKAFLLARGERNIRGHSALDLLDRCIAFDAGLERFRQDCRVLDRHYIPTRYPDALPEGSPYEAFGSDDADDAIRRAEGVVKAVGESLGFPPASSKATEWRPEGPSAQGVAEESGGGPPGNHNVLDAG